MKQLLLACSMMIFVFSISPIYPQIVSEPDEWELVFDGLDFPEGPAWDNSGNLFLSNCYGSWIARYNGNNVDTFLFKNHNKPSINQTNGLVVVDNYIYACDYGHGAILKISMQGEIEFIVDGYNGERFNRPNDIVGYGKNDILFTDPKSYGKDNLDGRVFKLNLETSGLKLIADNLAFPNGINISPVDNKIYVCESAKERIIRFDMNEEGMLVNKEVFIELPGGDPDGIEFDDKGNLYAAHFGGSAVYIISPDGNIVKKLVTPGKKPTNLEFGDSDKKTLYLTEVETNAVYKMKMNISGK